MHVNGSYPHLLYVPIDKYLNMSNMRMKVNDNKNVIFRGPMPLVLCTMRNGNWVNISLSNFPLTMRLQSVFYGVQIIWN